MQLYLSLQLYKTIGDAVHSFTFGTFQQKNIAKFLTFSLALAKAILQEITSATATLEQRTSYFWKKKIAVLSV